MDASQVIFILSAALIIASALMVVTTRNLIHAALWLIATLFGVAILYAVLEAGFLAVVQVVVYIGAIAIMFIFAVMLTRKEMRDKGPQVNASWPLSAVLGLLTFGGLFVIFSKWDGLGKLPVAIPGGSDALLSQLGLALTSPDAFVLPFEVASVLLLAALIGSVYVAMNKK
ncbi:MAG: NADH-quinone oxidoreductase subunit J [Chloroflexi bacterium]|nr:NADH-quinone oxidoreductase subunit J [Chloroflexota bacterium]